MSSQLFGALKCAVLQGVFSNEKSQNEKEVQMQLGFPDDSGTDDKDVRACAREMHMDLTNDMTTEEGPNKGPSKELLNQDKQADEGRLHEMGQGENNQDDQVLDHPPGFPTPKYKKKNIPLMFNHARQKRSQGPIRKSPRFTPRKTYAPQRKPREEKKKIDFKSRQEKIGAELAMEIIKESGAKLTEQVVRMFKEAEEKEPAMFNQAPDKSTDSNTGAGGVVILASASAQAENSINV